MQKQTGTKTDCFLENNISSTFFVIETVTFIKQ